ncbi:hypothetical protein SAY86_009305 [Trapa natans]|uniref:Uncharacterized protein n=1 Tax=Trapa natans TaxID=22666 RepID=A0AAN7L3P5_TRANT|nr:hypothetical protein SAY86_009305 [Trapa natans]
MLHSEHININRLLEAVSGGEEKDRFFYYRVHTGHGSPFPRRKTSQKLHQPTIYYQNISSLKAKCLHESEESGRSSKGGMREQKWDQRIYGDCTTTTYFFKT